MSQGGKELSKWQPMRTGSGQREGAPLDTWVSSPSLIALSTNEETGGLGDSVIALLHSSAWLPEDPEAMVS